MTKDQLIEDLPAKINSELELMEKSTKEINLQEFLNNFKKQNK